MQVQHQYALKQNFIKIEFENSKENWVFCAAYQTLRLLG